MSSGTRLKVDSQATSRFNLPAPFRGAAELIHKKQQMIAAVISKHSVVSPEQFLVAACAEVNSLEMSGRDEFCPVSVVKAVFNCATLGLLFGPTRGHAYLVPFRNRKAGKTVVNLIIGYRGFIELAYRSNFLVSVDTEVILHGETFKSRMTHAGRKLFHDLPIGRIAKKDGSNVVGAYCIYQARNGGHGISIVSKTEIDAVKKDSETWNFSYPAMARKTAVRRAAKNWSLSESLAAAVHLDEAAERETEQPLLLQHEIAPDLTQPPSPESSLPPSMTSKEETEPQPDGEVLTYFEKLDGLPSNGHLAALLNGLVDGDFDIGRAEEIIRWKLSQVDPRCSVITMIGQSTDASQIAVGMADAESLRQGGMLNRELFEAIVKFSQWKQKRLSS